MALFQRAARLARDEESSVVVYASYLEIYNERLHDLLEPFRADSTRFLAERERKAGLQIRDHPGAGPYVPGLTVARVGNPQGLLSLVRKGNKHREVRHTHMNMHSSRSHAILQLTVERHRVREGQPEVVRAKLNLVDLAGSERWVDGQVEDGQVAEMAAINQSLSALASVVAALTTGAQHVPYRDSKLTHLLADSLGGDCLTTLIATLSPALSAFQESLSTLRFADRARAITNRARRHAEADTQGQLQAKDAEIARLRSLLSLVTAAPEAREAAALHDKLRVAEGRMAGLEKQLKGMKEVLESERAQR